jgi:putative glutamine amidotransferase
MTERPRILITRAEDIPSERWEDYADCVRRAGGEPFAFDVAGFVDVASLPEHAGVLVTAGIDVDPARYGQPQSDRVTSIDPRRDEVETAIIQHALAQGSPLFCICRGFQVLNVALGGSLLQHLKNREPHRSRRGEDGDSIVSGWHPVEVVPGSLLYRITGQATLDVNSRHHQAVLPDGLAPGARLAATAPDGVVESIEVPGHPWALGVQWHPERPEMTDVPAMAAGSLALFDAFVEACHA